jgi:hypothetical protein
MQLLTMSGLAMAPERRFMVYASRYASVRRPTWSPCGMSAALTIDPVSGDDYERIDHLDL